MLRLVHYIVVLNWQSLVTSSCIYELQSISRIAGPLEGGHAGF